MIRSLIHGTNKRKLQTSLSVFFIALAIPTFILISQAFSQLKWEAFHRYQTQARNQIQHIDRKLSAIISNEESRLFTDYSFLNIAGDPSASFLQRSPLSQYPVTSFIPGLIGYFQVDPQDKFSTPLLPVGTDKYKHYGINQAEFKKRTQLQERIYSILSKNKLLQTRKSSIADKPITEKKDKKILQSRVEKLITSNLTPVKTPKTQTPSLRIKNKNRQTQAAFDQLYEEQRKKKKSKKVLPRSLGLLEDLNLESRYPEKFSSTVKKESGKTVGRTRVLRKEQNILPAQQVSPGKHRKLNQHQTPAAIDIRLFNSEIDSIEISILDSGHLVLFRKVWRNGQRYIQGMIITTSVFISDIIESSFQGSTLPDISNLFVAYRGNIISAFSVTPGYQFNIRSTRFQGDLLDRSKLSKPFNDLELVFNITNIPVTAESRIVIITASILVIVFIVGFTLLYRLGLSQINVTQQQQNFVSAVSHELKTPLTSIRLYGEILREGWASEDKKHQYYDYIFNESERLSRLINNVLQLSRITHNTLHADLKILTISELMDIIQSKISSQVEHAGFALNISCKNDIGKCSLNVDTDYFTQIFINLVDNALKFSNQNVHKSIDIRCEQQEQNNVLFSVRDYGPGIPPDQLKKIFTLFYRSENELTRETIGTGIGLALVQQFILAMNGHIDVVNKNPGAEFRISFVLHN